MRVFFTWAASVATQLWVLGVDVEIKSPVLRSAGHGLRKCRRGVFLLVVEEPELVANPIRSVGRYLTFAWILLLFSEIDGAFTFENAFFARACHVRALQRFLSFCFHNLHQTPQSFPKKGKKNLPISESHFSSRFAICSLYSWNICEPCS